LGSYSAPAIAEDNTNNNNNNEHKRSSSKTPTNDNINNTNSNNKRKESLTKQQKRRRSLEKSSSSRRRPESEREREREREKDKGSDNREREQNAMSDRHRRYIAGGGLGYHPNYTSSSGSGGPSSASLMSRYQKSSTTANMLDRPRTHLSPVGSYSYYKPVVRGRRDLEDVSMIFPV